MNNRIHNLIIAVILILLPRISETNAFFFSAKSSSGSTFSTTCWTNPSVPVLLYPANDTIATTGSLWDRNPYMDWEDSTSSCNSELWYQYESYRDASLTQLAYRSGWMSNSFIPAPGTPDGVYYWRVRSKDQYGHESSFSSAWKLTVDHLAPPTPLLISPGNNTRINSNQLVQTWQQVVSHLGGEIRYEYQSYRDVALTQLRWSASFTNTANGNGQVITKNAAGAEDGDVYWRVRSVDKNGNKSAWSEVWLFTIDHTIPNPTIDSIVNSSPENSVVLNEILPNPIGNDLAEKPNGEWIELYNKSINPINLTGYTLYDQENNSALIITPSNTGSGTTIIPGKGFLVVYRNQNIGFNLNDEGDTVRLFNKPIEQGGILIDSYQFTATPVGKSIARIPDGGLIWYDPIPTPGEPNILEEEVSPPMCSEPPLSLAYNADQHTVKMILNSGDLASFHAAHYSLTYNSQNIPKQIDGEIMIDNQDNIAKDIVLGTCSEKSCLYDDNPADIHMTVVLQGPVERTLTQEISP